MEEPREETESVGDCGEPMEEAGKGLGLSSKTETLVGEDANTVEVSDLGVCDENPNDGGLATSDGSLKVGDDNMGNSVFDEKQEKADVEDMVGSVRDEESKTLGSVDVKRTDAITEPETDMKCEGDTGTVEMKLNDETAKSEVENQNGASHETAGEEETVTPAANEATDEKAKCEVEDNGGACDAKQNVETEKSQQKSVDGETLSVAEDKADETTKKSEEGNNKMVVHSKREKQSANKSEEDNNKVDVDSKQENEENVALHEQGNLGYETKDAKHSESAQVPLSKDEPDEENQKEEIGEAMEIDCAVEEQVEKDIKVGGALDNACNESAGASIATQDVSIAEADNNDSNVVKEMEIDERKNNTDMAGDLTGTIESADSAIPNSPTEDAAPGEVEPLDHNALFDPTSDITNFIDFSGVSSWSGNIQDLKTDTRNVSLEENKKAADMAEEVATMGIENESNEARVAFGADSPAAAATDSSKEASDEILKSEKSQEDKDYECLDKKTADQQDTMREEDGITHDAPSIDPNQKEDIEMEENPNNSDYADDETGSDIKTNGVKRKADVLGEDSFAKVSFAQRPSFMIGACIARAASQMAGSPSVFKGSNFGDETLSVESFVSQLHSAATDRVKENVVSDIAVGFFLDFRNSSASQQLTPEKVSSKRARLSNSNAGGTEAFEFEEMGDTCWTDRVIHNGGEEQTPPTEKGNYQVVPLGEEDAAKGESSKTSKKSGRKTRMRERLAASSSRDPRAFGHLKLSEEHKSHEKVLTPYQRENRFFVYIDTDNIKNELPVSFDVNDMRDRIEVVLRARFNENYNVMKVVAIGNMWSFFDGERRHWRGVQVTDVYPRNAICGGICEQQIQFANPSLRRSVPYERCTDIADDMLQNAMFNDVQDYDPRNFLLITGDCDFVRPVTILEDCGVKVYLAAPRGCSGLLRGAVSDDCTFDFSEVYLR